jgi:hypothetical protein
MNFSKKNHEHQKSNRFNVSKTLNIKIVILCLLSVSVFAQQKLTKVSQTINANKDVTIDLNTNYVEIEIETWNKNTVEIEAYIEGKKLTKEELKEALDRWNVDIDGSGNYISIKSLGSGGNSLFEGDDYSSILRDLEIKLADLPEMPEMPEMPALMMKGDFPAMPKMPKMPKMPELPELPEGVKSVNFDYEKYKKEGEPYLEKWSKEYEEEYGKEYKEKMKNWARKFSESGFQEKMEKWGEEFGKKFEGDWAKDMEKWGEQFGNQFGKDWEKKMDKWGEEFEKGWGKDFEKKMEAWGERFGKEMEKNAEVFERMSENQAVLAERKHAIKERSEERKVVLSERRHEQLVKREAIIRERSASRGNNNVKRVIKIKMPKKAKLKMNVRHGELKLSSVIYNSEGQLSHTNLIAQSIDGGSTSINASYSSVLVDDWKNGSLSLKYVDDALLKNVNALTLNSNSSNINIDYMSGNSIIDGSFGELTIHNILDDFSNLNITLENSDAWVKLPNTEYSLLFKGERSKFNNEMTKQKVINSTSNKSIVVNAKFSNVVMQ